MTGCGGRTAEESPDAGVSVVPAGLEDACRALATVRETLRPRCGDSEPPGDRDVRTRMCVAMMSAPGSGATVADLQSCIRAMRADDCDTLHDQSWCSRIGGIGKGPSGSLPDGAACIASHQCVSGRCSGYDGNCGVCLAHVTTEGVPAESGLATGAACELLTDGCNDDAECEAAPGEVRGVCVERASLGESCTSRRCKTHLICDTTEICAKPHVAGEPCRGDFHFDCAPGLFCASGTCKPLVVAGAACAAGDSCVPGMHCHEGVCGPRRLDQPVGAPCVDDKCAVDLACKAGVCVSTVGVGASCKDTPCRPGLFCDLERFICTEKPTTGQTCSFEPGCAGEDYCPPPNGICRALTLEGGACGPGKSQCARGLLCIRDKCSIPNYAACLE